MRGALYREIGEMYFTLSWAVRELKDGVENWSVLSATYELLERTLSADTYTSAKALPVLTYGIKDFTKISVVYAIFSTYNMFFRHLGVNSEAFGDNTGDQTVNLKAACQSVINSVEGPITGLNKELLLAASRPAAQGALKELFERAEKANASEAA
jgi:hypothetical protein